MRNFTSYLLVVTIIILVAITNEKAIGQLNTSIIGVDTICVGQSSTYSVNVNTQSNKYLFRDTTAAQSGGNGFFALNAGYNNDIISNTFTYDLWVKPTRTINMYGESSVCAGGVSVPLANSNQNWAIVPVGLGGGEMSVGLTIGTNGLMVGEHSGNILVSRLSYTTPINDWVHVAIVYRTDSIFLLLNGDLIRSRQIHCTSNTKRVTSGLTGYYYSPDFKGNIDEFRLWDIALTPQDVMNIKDKKMMNQVIGLRYYASFDNGKFERTLGDIGTATMTVTGLSTANHLKASAWDLDKYSGASISSLTAFNISDLNYLWSTGSTTTYTAYVPLKGVNYLTVNTFNDSYSKTDTIIIFGKDCDGVALSSGLIAYYPFNGNANDESGNGNDGLVNGASLIKDRFGSENGAYYFSNSSDIIRVPHSSSLNLNGLTDNYSISLWYYLDTKIAPTNAVSVLIAKDGTPNYPFKIYHSLEFENDSVYLTANIFDFNNNIGTSCTYLYPVRSGWHNLVFVVNNDVDSAYMYLNGSIISKERNSVISSGSNSWDLTIGNGWTGDGRAFYGALDDIRIYNRAINELEIANLFFGGNICTETVYDTVNVVVYDTITRVNNRIQYIKFESYYSADNGQVNVYDIKAYSKTENIALNKPVYANSCNGSAPENAVDNNEFSRWSGNRNDAGPDSVNPHFIVVDLQNITPIDSIILNIKGFDSWKQVFDLSVSSDSIHWSSIGKGDSITGIFTYFPDNRNTVIIYDTIRVSVTDTLIIDVLLTDVQSNDNINTIKVYPNPTKDYLFINTGDYQTLNGYSMKIINQLGATVFQTNIENPLYEINLSSWSGKGLYFIQIIDSSDRIIDIKKIVLQ